MLGQVGENVSPLLPSLFVVPGQDDPVAVEGEGHMAPAGERGGGHGWGRVAWMVTVSGRRDRRVGGREVGGRDGGGGAAIGGARELRGGIINHLNEGPI